jgi:hypothetical protein
MVSGSLMEAYGGIRRGGGEFAVRYAHMNLSGKKRRRIEGQGVQSDPNEIRELAGDLPLQILVVDSLIGFGGLLELNEGWMMRGMTQTRVCANLRQAVGQEGHRELLSALEGWLAQRVLNFLS